MNTGMTIITVILVIILLSPPGMWVIGSLFDFLASFFREGENK